MKLYATPGSFRAQKVLIAAQYAGASLEVCTEKDAAKGKAPANRLPVLETAEGVVFGSNAIARFLARSAPGSGLFGERHFHSALVDSWVDFSANELEVPACSWIYPILGWMDNHPQVTANAKKDLKKAVMLLEAHLQNNTFVVGRSVTLADIALACALVLPMKLVYTNKDRKAFPCVTRWFTTCVNQPAFLAVLGETTLCTKALVAKGGEKPKKEGKKKAKKEKAAKPAQAPKKKKAKNPLDLLPKSSFSLDAWKTRYSNPSTDNFYDCMKYFWENFDNDGWSIYLSDYKYNDENKVGFMVSNLCGGFVQRCDEVRKYAMGTLQIVGQDGGPMKIKGCWIFRGHSAQPMLDANPDAEHHEWVRVTDFNEENKKKIADLWCADAEIEGMPIMDCKVFK